MAPERSGPGRPGPALSPSESVGVAAVAVILVLALASQLLDYGVYDHRVRALDTSSETGMVGLLGQGATFAAAASAWFAAIRLRRAAPTALAVLLTFLAVDHAAQLHEEVPRWRLAYLPLLAVTFLALVAMARGPASGGDRLLIWGVALLAASLALHEIGGWLMVRAGVASDSWVFQIKLGVKHGTEVAGWLLVALGLATAWRARSAGGPEPPAVPERERLLVGG